METIYKAIELNLKQGKIIKCIHITKEDLEQIKTRNIFNQSEELKTILFGYSIKEDIDTFIE